ncbi:MAG: aspartate carbamoyltransferase catalytic subunit [Verrucomicrobiae bacterium]|nr:aspartate carbamoyltransferase catalytic subunit [Verrucomicrobiae bacterium]MCP5550361.1 aspartate carbamoyltransferase catalytic subunit [Akkermansiaceae bacterium]
MSGNPSKTAAPPSRKDLLDIASLSVGEIEHLIETAGPFKDLFQRSVKKVPALRGKTVLNLFYEPSTRTSSSFEVAANRLSADVTNFAVSQSSVVKGESVLDTIDTLQAMRTDYIVIRHSASGIPAFIAKNTRASVINAGDGFHAHPTQALLDLFTLREVFDDTAGKRVLIVGDILHSRVARSTSTICRKVGVEVGVLGPGPLVPGARHEFMRGFRTWDEAFAWRPDVIYLLRVQLERQKEQFFPSLGEYHKVYGLTLDRYRRMRDEGLWLMHPGPVNRGVEIVDEAMTYERSLINQQVENGIAVRMAVLYWLLPETGKRA